MSKYRRRTLQEKKGGGFTELLEGRVSERMCMCVCVHVYVRAAKICRALKSLHSVQSSERVLLSSALKGVILLNSTGRLQIRSIRLGRKSSSKETSKNWGSAVSRCLKAGSKGKSTCPNYQSSGILPKPTGSGAEQLRLLPHAKKWSLLFGAKLYEPFMFLICL